MHCNSWDSTAGSSQGLSFNDRYKKLFELYPLEENTGKLSIRIFPNLKTR